METRKVVNKSLFQGNNEFETGILTVAANTTVPAGALLKREASGKFAVITDTGSDKPIAVNPVELKNPGSAAADMPFRACIAGKVRFDMLSVGGNPVTDEQADLLNRFVPVKVTDLSRDFWE
jgi:hypothetical protein